MARLGLAAFAVVVLGASVAEAARLALVVGNADYQSVTPLKNAVNDATDVAAALERLGFEVTLLTDAGSDTFWAKLDAFGKKAETAEATLFFYSGHAFQMAGVNYLVPVNAQLTSREAIKAETWSLDGVIARLQARNRQTLIFLDACRNDPVPASVRGSGAAADGLARLQTGVGTFVAFATEPGAVTFDGAADARNSPFTTALLDNIETPGISISDMMIEVRNEVEESTLRRQTPWDQSSLRSQFYFVPEEEKKQELSDADFELLAQLEPDDRKKFIDLLRLSGFSEDSLTAAEASIAVAAENLQVVADSSGSIAAPTASAALTSEPVIDAGDLASLTVVEDGGGSSIGGTAPAAEQLALNDPEPVAVPPTSTAQPAPGVAPATVGTVVPTTTVTGTPTGSVAATATAGSAATAVAATTAGTTGAATTVTAAAPATAGTTGVATTVTATASSAVATALDVPESALARPGDDSAPIRLAALSWDTREVGLQVFGNRTIVEGRGVEPDSDDNRAVLAAIDPALLAPQAEGVNPAELALAVQGELKRLGCYQMRVDGDWGKGSRTALTSYFLAKKVVPDTLEPTVALYDNLRAETKVVCAVRVAVSAPRKPRVEKPAAEVAKPAGGTVKIRNKVVPKAQVKKEIKKSLLGGSGSF